MAPRCDDRLLHPLPRDAGPPAGLVEELRGGRVAEQEARLVLGEEEGAEEAHARKLVRRRGGAGGVVVHAARAGPRDVGLDQVGRHHLAGRTRITPRKWPMSTQVAANTL